MADDAAPAGLDPRDRDAMIRTVLTEARSNDPEGWAAVASTIRNRLAKGNYGDSPSAIVKAPGQFEVWANGRAQAVSPSHPNYEAAGRIVDAIASGLPDTTGGATHFYSPAGQAALGRAPPAWGRQPLTSVGGNTFFAPHGRVTFQDAPAFKAIETATSEKPVADQSDEAFLKQWGVDPKAVTAAPSAAGSQASPALSKEDEGFLKQWGVDPSKIQQGAPAGGKSGSGAIEPGDAAAAIGSGIGDLPIVGPYVKEGMLRAAHGIASAVNPAFGLPVRSLDEMRQWDAQLRQNHPYAYTGGQVLGGAAALLPAAATGAGAVALGARAPAFVTDAAGAIPAIARLGTQAGFGGSTNALVSAADAYMRGEDPTMAAGVGGALGAAGPVVGGAALGAGRVGRSLIEPFVPGGPQRIADRVIAKAAAGSPLAVDRSKLGSVPGSTPTLAEVTGNAGIAGLERGVRSTPEGIVPFNLRDTERQAARGELVSGVRGDPVSLDGMIADRQAATDPLREAAFANAGKADPSNVVKKINEILAGPEGQRDAVVNTLGTIKRKIVKSGGTAADPMATITGGAAKPPTLESDPNQLYGIRKAIGDILDKTGPKTENDARLATSQLMDIKRELDRSITKAAPKFSEYIDKFADLSKPINAEKWMQGLSLTDMRGKVTLGNVNRAIESTEKARLRGGANDAKSVPDEVLQKLYGLRNDLRSQLDAAERGRAAGSPTVQNLATQNFAQSAGIPMTTAATIASGHPLVGVPLHWLSRAIEARNPAVTNALINRLLTPDLPTSAAFAGGLPGGGMLNPGALLAPGLIPPNRNRLTER